MKPRLQSARAFLLSALVFTLLSSALPAAATASATPALTGDIDRFLSQAYPAAEPGAAVLVIQDGQTLVRKGYGMANLELEVPVTPETVFEVGSVTKQFTATAILMLQERGLLSVQDDITKYLTDFPTQGKKVTIENLLTHTSGIPSYTGMPEWGSQVREDLPLEKLIAFFKGKPFDFEPGTKWDYDNSGYVLLGAILEKVSGKSYQRFIEDEIFKPLGMTHSHYGSWSDVIPHRAAGYDKEGDHFVNTPYISMTQPYAAGSLMSTVDDLALWDKALSAGTLVKKASLERMLTPSKLASGASTRYGYGWVLHDLAGKRAVEHGGDINGFSCDVLRLPEEKIFVVVLTNNPEAALRPDGVANRIARKLLGVPDLERKARLDAKALDEYPGVYRAGEVTRIVTREGDKLFIRRHGGTKREIVPTGPDTFTYAMTSTMVRFSRDARGKVKGALVDGFIGPEEPEMARTDDPMPADRQAAHVDPAVFSPYTGTYELAPGFQLVITREGDHLFVQATGQQKNELFPESETKFFLKVVDAQIEFQKDGGAVTGLVLHQGGQDTQGKRLR